MAWLLVALIPPLVWSVATILDKLLITKVLKDGLSAGIATNAFSGVLPLLLVPFFPLAELPLWTISVLVVAGVLWGFARLTYCIAMAKEEASRIVPFLQLNPIIILLFSALFLHEQLSLLEAFGFLLILASALWISIRRANKAFKPSAAMPWLIVNNLAIAAAFILLKSVAGGQWWSALVWINIGFAASSLILLPTHGQPVWRAVRSSPRRSLALLLGIGALTLTGRATLFLALGMAPAALVSVVSATQTLFVLGLTTLLSVLAPSLIAEDISPRVLLSKLGAICLLLAGFALLALQ